METANTAYLIVSRVGEAQRQLCRLNVKGADDGLSALQQVWPVLQAGDAILRLDCEPVTSTHT